MNPTETNSPDSDLSSQVAALQRQVFTLLVTLVVVSGTLSAFLCYQSHTVGKDIETIRPQATKLIQDFGQVQAVVNPKIVQNFLNQLIAFGQTHHDFLPVLAKYGIVPAPAPPAAPAAPRK